MRGLGKTEAFGDESVLVKEQSALFFPAQPFAKMKTIDGKTGFSNLKEGKSVHDACNETGSISISISSMSSSRSELSDTLDFIVKGHTKHKFLYFLFIEEQALQNST